MIEATETLQQSINLQTQHTTPTPPVRELLTLQACALEPPQDSITINGSPYGLNIDRNLMVTAINELSLSKGSMKFVRPGLVSFEHSSGTTTVTQNRNSEPVFMAPTTNDQTPLLSTLKGRTQTRINLTLPQEIKSADYSTTAVARLFTSKINQDFLTALSQNLRAQNELIPSMSLRKLLIGIGAAAASSTGVALQTGAERMAFGGIAGALIGATAVGAAIMTTDIFRGIHEYRYQYAEWAVKKAGRKPGTFIEFRQVLAGSETPIFTLVPIAAKPASAETPDTPEASR